MGWTIDVVYLICFTTIIYYGQLKAITDLMSNGLCLHPESGQLKTKWKNAVHNQELINGDVHSKKIVISDTATNGPVCMFHCALLDAQNMNSLNLV